MIDPSIGFYIHKTCMLLLGPGKRTVLRYRKVNCEVDDQFKSATPRQVPSAGGTGGKSSGHCLLIGLCLGGVVVDDTVWFVHILYWIWTVSATVLFLLTRLYPSSTLLHASAN